MSIYAEIQNLDSPDRVVTPKRLVALVAREGGRSSKPRGYELLDRPTSARASMITGALAAKLLKKEKEVVIGIVAIRD